MREQLTRRLPYAPAQLFALVGDVERYPEFVPWVSRLAVRGRREPAPGLTVFDAEAEVGFSIVRERFATRVRLDEPALAIDVSLISGPFRRLANRWRFAPEGAAARLEFEIEFEFKSKILTALFALNAHRAIARLVGCFEERARALYGAPPEAM